MSYPDTRRPERQYALETLAAADDARAEEPADRRDERRPSAAEYEETAERYRAQADRHRALAEYEEERDRPKAAATHRADAAHADRLAADYQAAAEEATL